MTQTPALVVAAQTVPRRAGEIRAGDNKNCRREEIFAAERQTEGSQTWNVWDKPGKTSACSETRQNSSRVFNARAFINVASPRRSASGYFLDAPPAQRSELPTTAKFGRVFGE